VACHGTFKNIAGWEVLEIKNNNSSLTLCVLQNFRGNGPLYNFLSIADNDQWRRIRSVLSLLQLWETEGVECLSWTNRLVQFPQALDLTVNQHVQCCNSTLIKITREQEQGQEGKTKQKELIPPL
jgi:hypothetical protein